MANSPIISLEVLSPEKTLVNETVEAVFFPGSAGSFEVLKDHAPLISSLQKGEIIYRTQAEEKRIAISSGFVEVCDNHVVACVEI